MVRTLSIPTLEGQLGKDENCRKLQQKRILTERQLPLTRNRHEQLALECLALSGEHAGAWTRVNDLLATSEPNASATA
jgi:hypothetical protein